jgi:malate dehydrogenase (oxaloacetate-decarboxylating)(NADP+)
VDCPVFHDDQWGTAIITLAALKNYALLTKKSMEDLSVVINGAGAAGIRIAETIKNEGVKSLLLLDSRGIIHDGREDLNPHKKAFAVKTSKRTLAEAIEKADVFIGVSVPGLVKGEMVLTMRDYPGIFAMANPEPEITPEEVKNAMGNRAYIMATGRSDYPNQINNVLGFPYIFRGALDVQAKHISMSMKKAAAEALAIVARQDSPNYLKDAYPGDNLSFGPSYIIPKPFDRRLLVEVSYAVAEAACQEGNASIKDLSSYRHYLEALAYTPSKDITLPFIIERFSQFGNHILCHGHTPEGVKNTFICDPKNITNLIHDKTLLGRPLTIHLKKGKLFK